MAQIVYYFAAAVALGAPHRPVSFAVPTGNFGNVYAGYAARRMGLPISQLVVGTNRNDILTRFFESGAMSMDGGRAHPVARAWTSRSRAISSVICSTSSAKMRRRGAAISWSASARTAASHRRDHDDQRSARLFSGHRVDDDGTRRPCREIYRDDRRTARPAPRRRRRRRRGPAAATPPCRWWRSPPPIPPNSRLPSRPPPASVPHLPPRLADLFERPSATTCCPTTSTP